MWKFGGKWIRFFVVIILLSSCGDAVSPGVEIVSDPPEATVRIGDEIIGKTPVLVPGSLLKDHSLDTFTLIISKEGYEKKQVVIKQKGGILNIKLERE